MVEMVSVHGNRCGENPVYAVAEAAEMVESETEDAEVGSGGPEDRLLHRYRWIPMLPRLCSARTERAER